MFRARPQRGFTYLGLLLLLAVQGAALAALGQRVASMSQRDREAELLFRGEQIRQAIENYRDARAPATWPKDFDDLLVDRRGEQVRYHLRRRWVDPFTGQADWRVVRDTTNGGMTGVYSAATARRLRADGPLIDGEGPPRVSDWHFMAGPGRGSMAGAAASAPSN